VPEPPKSFYERDRERRGLRYPSEADRERGYARPREELLVPEDLLRVGENPETAAPVGFQPSDLATHLHVIGGSGRGKSFFLRKLVSELLRRHEKTGEGLAIVDPHGTLAEFALDQCMARGDAFADQVVYFDLKHETRVPVFNPLRRDLGTFYAANGFVEAIGKVFGAERTTENPLTSQVILNTAAVLLENGLSVAEAGFFLENSLENHAVRRLLLAKVGERKLRDFWEKVAGLPPREQDGYTASASRRFDYLLRSPSLRRMVGQTTPGLDLRALMDEGGIAIFNLAREGTDLTVEQQRLVGSLLIQEVRNVTERRTPDVSRPFTLIVDEFGDFVSADAMRIFTGARKFGLRCVLSHQDMEQLLLRDRDFRLHAAVLAIENKVVFGGGPTEDALKIAHQVYAGFVDTEERKLEIRSKGFKPVPTPTELRSRSSSRSTGRSGGETSGRGSSETTSEGGDSASTSESSGDSSGWSEGETDSESVAEGWVTFYEEFEQLASVQFRSVEEQIFRHMQRLHRQPTGRCVVVARGKEPVPCEVPDMEIPRAQAAARQRFLERIFRKPMYLVAAEADGLIAARSTRLLAEATAPKRTELEEPADLWTEPVDPGPEQA
jgi:hypothetical protein